VERCPRPNGPPPPGLFDSKDIQAHAQQADSEYGKDFAERDWADIAQRLEQLARLIWQFSVREVEEEAKEGEKPGGEATPPAGDRPLEE
jgi:hypothetical protein